MNKIKQWIEKIGGVGLAAIAGVLWYKGGEGNKALRRVGVASIIALIAAYKIGWSLWLLSVPVIGLLAFGAYAVGYGVPDESDEGSAIAQFWERWFPWQTEEDKLRFVTRATTGFLYGLNYLVTGAIIGHVWQSVILVILSTLGVGTICHFRLDVQKEATLIGTLLVALALMI
jgi:hypothetical protein